MRNLFLATAFTLATSLCHAQSLWMGTSVGMSPEQVIASVPGSRMVPAHKSRGTQLTKVALDGVRIADTEFQAEFSFEADRLVTVDLSARNLPDAQFVRARESILNALRAKYGPESSREGGHFPSFTFLSGPTVIKVLTMWISQGNLYVMYSAQAGADASRL